MKKRNRVLVLSSALILVCVTSRLSSQTTEAQPQPPAAPQPAQSLEDAESEPFVHVPPPRHVVVASPPADPTEFKISSEVDLVLLDVSVRGENGGFVSGLEKSNFKVYEDKVEQPITVFNAQDVPVTIGLIVDNSGSVRPKKPEIVTAALTFVGKSNPKDEVFVVNFNESISLGLPPAVPFSGDRILLRQALLRNPAQGRTALYDAIHLGLDHLKKGRMDKKTLVVISDGGDNSSELTRREIMHAAEESLATIYTVGIFDPDDNEKNPRFLKSLANLTGGEAFIPQNTNNLIGICEKIASDIRNRYSLGFAPASTKLDGGVRKLNVVATHPDFKKKLRVRTRTHYVAAVRSAQSTGTHEPQSQGNRSRGR